MAHERIVPGEIRIFLNHLYEFKKGIRHMVLHTMNKEYEDFAVRRLRNQNIGYLVQPIDNSKVNLYFGKKECLYVVKLLMDRPLNLLTPEEDFIVGAMLGYDICQQCKRFCGKKVSA